MRTILTLACAAILVLGSCSKEDSAGPRPPMGPEDIVGESFNFKVKAEDWLANGVPGDDLYGFAIKVDVPILTSAIVENGTIRVYLKRGSSNWAQLPMMAHQGAPHGVNWRYTYELNKVRIMIDRNGEMIDPPDELLVFKVVAFANHGLQEGLQAE